MIKCTSPCKSWCSLVKSPKFFSTRHGIYPLLLLCLDMVEHWNSLCVLATKSLRSTCVYHSSIANESFRVLGSCNGIVCVSKLFNGKLIIWNPSIRKSITLPNPVSATGSALVLSFSSNDCKVL
ncbi:hypothetical protein P3X46_006802 [Hevea brasiliensis]|uniref:F-box domain-containing protein n=1 Tax=Hevea brasiliensis TaxID=3981 RepID=A0ABQ9MTZ3_HEVBR|nr:hypothetical protein P3X46_006802 [Hevea brasiliensis]